MILYFDTILLKDSDYVHIFFFVLFETYSDERINTQ